MRVTWLRTIGQPASEPGTAELLDNLLQKRSRRLRRPNRHDGRRLPHHRHFAHRWRVLRTDHPTLTGRVLVRIPFADGPDADVWLPTLQGLAGSGGDRLIVVESQQPSRASSSRRSRWIRAAAEPAARRLRQSRFSPMSGFS